MPATQALRTAWRDAAHGAGGLGARRSGGAAHAQGGAQAQFSLVRKGVYKFKTRADDDNPGMDMQTVGPDRVLRLTIVVG